MHYCLTFSICWLIQICLIFSCLNCPNCTCYMKLFFKKLFCRRVRRAWPWRMPFRFYRLPDPLKCWNITKILTLINCAMVLRRLLQWTLVSNLLVSHFILAYQSSVLENLFNTSSDALFWQMNFDEVIEDLIRLTQKVL